GYAWCRPNLDPLTFGTTTAERAPFRLVVDVRQLEPFVTPQTFVDPDRIPGACMVSAHDPVNLVAHHRTRSIGATDLFSK
ncbi:MAG: hypothetical protein WC372_09390, partial [Candidatus Neomarinimicrobiota bacterium]